MATEFPTYAVTTEGSDAILAGITFAPVAVAGTTDTLAAADHGKVNYYTDASLVTVTIPTDAADDLADGFECLLVAAGAGGLELDTTGITLVGSSPSTTIEQNESLYVKKTATANTWIVLGGGTNISDILTDLLTVDGDGSGLDADKLDGLEGSAYQTALSGAALTDVGTPASGDRIVLQDASDSNNIKVAQFSTFGGGSSDPLDANSLIAVRIFSR